MQSWKQQYRVPGSERKREGQKKKEGGHLRRYKRCSVFSGKRARDVGRKGGSLFDLRSRGLI